LKGKKGGEKKGGADWSEKREKCPRGGTARFDEKVGKITNREAVDHLEKGSRV